MTDRPWPIEKLGRTARIGNGSTPRRDSAIYWDGGDVPWLNSSVVNESRVTQAEQFVTAAALRECHLPVVAPGSVLVGLTGQGKTRGMATVLDIEATLNQHVAYVTPDRSRWFPEYLLWSLRAAYNELRSLSEENGSTKGGLTCEALKQFRLALPPLGEQRRIAAYLGEQTEKIDMLVEEQQRLIELLRERRHAVVDRVIRGGVVNARMTDSGDPLVGEVPQGWSVVPIRRVAASLDSRRIPLSSEQRAERTGPFPYYGATSVIDYVDDYIFDEPLVLVAEDGFGLLYRSKPIAVHVEGRIWVNNHAHVLRPLGVPAYLLAARIESENLVPYLAGSRQPKLTAEALMGMRISIPPEDQWSQILTALDAETAKIDTLIAETERFVELARERRSALISAAVAGQIDMQEMA